MPEVRFHIEGYRLKTKYTIEFTVTCSRSINKIKIEYNGTELNVASNVGIPEDRKESLKTAFQNEFGYGPFDKKEIQRVLSRKSIF